MLYRIVRQRFALLRYLNYVPYTLSPREIEAGVRRYLVL
jgi:hypothetical protein